MDFIDALLLSYRFQRFKRTSSGCNFRCPYCGDSRTSKKKARGYLYQQNDDWLYKCHNCGIARRLSGFLKDHAPDLLEQCQDQDGLQRHSGGPVSASNDCRGVMVDGVTKLPRGGADEYDEWRRAKKWTPAHLYRGEKKRF